MPAATLLRSDEKSAANRMLNPEVSFRRKANFGPKPTPSPRRKSSTRPSSNRSDRALTRPR